MATIYETLQSTNLPCCYSHFRKTTDPIEPPYLAYIGNGQNQLDADNTLYWRENTYQVELYFTQKDEALEADVEDALLSNGFLFTKSEDIFIEEQNIFVIYYYIS